MINNQNEIENAVKNMIERYGEDALKEVDLRILELESRNKQVALPLWYAIREKVELLVVKSASNTKH